MKKLTLLSVASLSAIALSVGLSTTSAFADASAAPESTTSKADVSFTPNSGPTDPLDPNDPNNPFDPEHPTDPADPDNPGTGNSGPLSLDRIANIQFSEHEVNGDETTFNAINKDPYLQVSDTRAEATGWILTAKMTKPFTGAKDQSVLEGTSMDWTNGTVKTTDGNKNVAPVGSNLSLDADGTEATLMKADPETGQGTWLDVFAGGSEDMKTENTNVSLKVPGGQATAQAYQAEITWTLADTPAE